jgi:hypothetical protein
MRSIQKLSRERLSQTNAPGLNNISQLWICHFFQGGLIMEKEKKNYIKPEVKKIKLDAKTAVLAVCKTTGSSGRSGGNCGPPIFQPCQDNGS